MMMRETSTKKVIKRFGAGGLCLLLVLFSQGFGITLSVADEAVDVPAAVTPPDSKPKGEPIAKARDGQVVEPAQKDVQLPSVLKPKSTGYPSFYGGADGVKGRIRSSQRDLSQSTRSLNESVRRMNDAVNRMRYLPKRF
jgi:hypothetical protein